MMCDRIINSSWWLAIMALIAGTSSAALAMGYRGMFELLGGRFSQGSTFVGASFACGVAAWTLCRHRNDLI
jgi:hypothetical protein